MLTFQYIPRNRLLNLTGKQKIQLILSLVKDHRLLIIEGRLNNIEEAELIRETMVQLNTEFNMKKETNNFNGVEIGVMFSDDDDKGIVQKTKSKLAKWLLGETKGITIIGPAQIIKELRQEPEKIHLYLQTDYLKNNYFQNKKIDEECESKTKLKILENKMNAIKVKKNVRIKKLEKKKRKK